jgi:putative hydrolase of the HAD superfamily
MNSVNDGTGFRTVTIEGILFDVYDTLVFPSMSDEEKAFSLMPPGQAIPSAGQRTLARKAAVEFYHLNRHLPRALSDIREFWRRYFDCYLESLGIGDPGRTIAAAMADWSRDPAGYTVTPGSFELLTGLRRKGYRVGMLSNWDVSLPQFCREIGFTPEMATMILASDEIGLRKPDPALFLEGCRRLGTPPDRTLFVGDSLEKDILGAMRAGLESLWYNPGFKGIEAIQTTALKPARIIRDLRQLEQLLPGDSLLQL